MMFYNGQKVEEIKISFMWKSISTSCLPSCTLLFQLKIQFKMVSYIAWWRRIIAIWVPCEDSNLKQRTRRKSLRVVFLVHYVFINSEKQMKSRGVRTSSILKRGWQFKGLRCICIIWLSTRKQFKSCSVYPSYGYQQESILKVVVSMHHTVISKEAVWKFWCLCIVSLSPRKQFESCGVNAL